MKPVTTPYGTKWRVTAINRINKAERTATIVRSNASFAMFAMIQSLVDEGWNEDDIQVSALPVMQLKPISLLTKESV